MSYPVNATHRLLLENGSYLLLEDGTSKVILDENVAIDDPQGSATTTSLTPTFSFAGEAMLQPLIDNVGAGSDTTASPVVWTHQIGKPNTLLVVSLGVQGVGAAAATVTGVTYAGKAMTKTIAETGSNVGAGWKNEVSIWFLYNPPQGIGSVSATVTAPTGSPDYAGVSTSYYQAQASSTADASGGASASAAGSLSASLTTVAQNAWVVIAANSMNDGSGNGTIIGQKNVRGVQGMATNVNGQLLMCDTGGGVGAGSNSLALIYNAGSGASNELFTIALASFAPAPNANLHYEIQVDTANTFDSQ